MLHSFMARRAHIKGANRVGERRRRNGRETTKHKYEATSSRLETGMGTHLPPVVAEAAVNLVLRKKVQQKNWHDF